MFGVKFPKKPDGSELTEEEKEKHLEELIDALSKGGFIATPHYIDADKSDEENLERIKAEHEREVLRQKEGKDDGSDLH